MTDLLSRPCPFCGHAYAEHDLEGLATCVEENLIIEEPAGLRVIGGDT